jgi:hypothetical protein
MTMNGKVNDARTLDERMFDRLADGELDAAACRALLSRLDEVPGGWRLCALAFLESQAWRSEMRLVEGKSGTAVLSPEIARGDRARGVRARRAGLMALVLVAAFAGGWLIRPGGEVVRDKQFARAAKSVAKSDEGAVKLSNEMAPSLDASGLEPPPATRLAGVLTLTIDESGQPREVRVPVIEGPGIDSRRLLEQPPAISASVMKELTRRGHKVESHRQLLTVDLKDGRKVLLPVDQVDVRFANRVFQ